MQAMLVNMAVTLLTGIIARILSNATKSATFAALKERVRESEGLVDDFFLALFESAVGVVEDNGPEIAEEFKAEMEKLKR